MNTKIFKLITAIIAVWFTTGTITAQETKTMYMMRDGEVVYQSVVSDVDSIVFYKPAVIPKEGVLINGVIWAKYNVDEPGKFAAKPENPGMFYQWNRIKAWPALNQVDGWDTTLPEGDTWEEANDPSPAGWRIPDTNDIQKLCDTQKVTRVWTTENNEKGMKFTDKATGEYIFMPAVGFRYYTDGSVRCNKYDPFNPQFGYYWSSKGKNNSSAWGMDFGSSGVYNEFDYNRIFGFPIRCVAK